MKLLVNTALVLSATTAIPMLSASDARAEDWNYVFCAADDGRWEWLGTENITDEMYAHGARSYRNTAFYYGHWRGNQWWPNEWAGGDIGWRCAEVEAACRSQLGTNRVYAQASSGSSNQYWRQLASCNYYQVSD